MKRWLTIATLLISILIVATAPATAQTFDNDGGGTWKEYMSFPITASPTEYAQYKIVVNGTNWEIYNATGGLEASGTNANFWSLVNSTGADIRVFNQGAQLYFWIEYFNATEQKAIIWVNLTAGSTELNIAYGNPSALPSTYDNASKTFEIYDDFNDGVLDTNIWIDGIFYGTGTASAYEQSGFLVIDVQTNTVGYAVISKKQVQLPVVVESSWYGNIANIGEMWTLITSDTNLTDGFQSFVRFGYNSIPDFYYQELPVGGTVTTIETFARQNPTTNTPIKVVWDNNSKYFENDIQVNTIETQSVYPRGSLVSVGFTAYTSRSSPLQIYIDYIKVYKLADPADFGTPLIKSFQKKFGTKTVYINVTYLDTLATSRYNPTAYYKLEDKPQINVSSFLSVNGVNATYGANISIELINFVTLDKVVYNGTDMTANLTYQGTITNATTGYIYNVYSFTTYENGTLEIYGHVGNEAYNASFALDNDLVDVFNTIAVLGEMLKITLTHPGNVTVGSLEFVNVTQALVNTKDLGTGVKTLTITIEDPENFTVGYKYGQISVEFGRLNVSVRHKDLSPFDEAIVSAFNENYSILSTDMSKLYAGVNTISVYFHGVKLKSVTFYLNHSTNGANITVDTNSTKFVDYRGVSRIVASPNSFELVNLSSSYPYSVMEIRNFSGTVVVDYGANPPTSVSVIGASSVEYVAPVLKFTGSGNATVTDLYRLSVQIRDRLGNPVNFYVLINGSRVDASNGVAKKLLKPSWYEVVAPATVNGFELWKFNDSSNRALVEVNASDVNLPVAEYRVPTKIESKEVRITSGFWWLPFPFLAPKQNEEITVVRLEGSLKDFYNAPVINRIVKVEIISKNFTRIYNVTTDESGNFRLEVDMAKGIEYTVTYKFEGDDIYVGTTTQKTFLVEQLLPAPIAPEVPTLLIVMVVAVVGAGVVAAAIYLSKKRTAVARARIESEFRFFRRLP